MKNHSRNIAINATMLDEHPTGVGNYSIHIINQLAGLFELTGDRLTVFTASSGRLNKKLKFVHLSGLIKSSQYGRFAALNRFLYNTFVYPFQVREYDLVLSPTTHGSLHLKSQIITIHDLLSLRYDNISLHQRFYFRYLLPRMVKKARKIITVSHATKKDIIEFLHCPENKIEVIHSGYDEETYNTNSKKPILIFEKYGVKNYFLAIGPTYPHKNIQVFIDAYASLPLPVRNKYPVVIAGGKNKYVTELKSLVAKNKLGEYIHFLGYVPQDLMASLYKESYLMVFPSFFEGFGFPLLEAMACGCPVIASDTSSIPEVCGDAVLYFNPYNSQALAKHISHLISDPELYNDCIKKGLEQVKKFSWIKTGKKLKTIIEETIN